MKILAIGAHPDDIETGCYATLKKLQAEQNAQIYYLMLTLGGDSGNAKERRVEQRVAAQSLNAQLTITGLPSAYLNNDSGRATIKAIETELSKIAPDMVFSHSSHDRHQDHRLVNEATVSACRFYTGEVLFYEGYSSLKYFTPTIIYRVDDYFPAKLDIMKLFKTQSSKFYVRGDVLDAIATFRAAQFGYSGKAEAFEIGGGLR